MSAAAHFSVQADASRTPRHVAFVVFQTGDRANGGVESVTRVLEGLSGVDRTVITQRETEVNDRWRTAGCQVAVWRIDSINQKRRRGFQPADLISMLRVNARVARLVRANGIDVVHCNDFHFFWYVAFGARAARAKLVMNFRGVKPPGELYSRLHRMIPRLTNGFIFLSNHMKETLTDRLRVRAEHLPHGNGSNARAIYSIVDPTEFRPPSSKEREALRRERGIADGEFPIGFVATFNPGKAQLPFIERALPRLRQLVPSARVYFIGDFDPERNEYAAACVQAVERLGVDDEVRFLGYTDAVADWYRSVDLVVLPSRREGMARCMIESIACGTPVVSFEVCSAREILEGHEAGRVVDQGDYNALLCAIDELAHSPGERERLGANGARAARRLFDPEAVLDQYRSFYREI